MTSLVFVVREVMEQGSIATACKWGIVTSVEIGYEHDCVQWMHFVTNLVVKQIEFAEFVVANRRVDECVLKMCLSE
ncbi:unnamed protein product [Litomosoides sigmodontis]|uniref:Uncharacterized protein n=1 Tax=Litomosoides sigmodontis TaxID=42156 RepID=A0A3P6TR53_LITSI|nr:unnamed protein product [Litomosoides sigmodontis]